MHEYQVGHQLVLGASAKVGSDGMGMASGFSKFTHNFAIKKINMLSILIADFI